MRELIQYQRVSVYMHTTGHFYSAQILHRKYAQISRRIFRVKSVQTNLRKIVRLICHKKLLVLMSKEDGERIKADA